MHIKEAQQKVKAFTSERAWDIISPTQRGAHLVREVGKLCEYILFHEGVTTKATEMEKMPKQLGDVMFSLMALANKLDIDLTEQLGVAINRDAKKYPAEETRADALHAFEKRLKPLYAKLIEDARAEQ
jgi:NTP pyrophosphatase (non-canonical NTP hydrolase)